jgi:hypothetical protein
MRANANVSPLRKDKGKSRLLASGAVAAGLAAIACGGTARAQVAANPVYIDVGAGTSVNSNSITKTTTVTITQSQNIINWVPTDTAANGGAIDLLPADSNWRFTSTDDFVVLNRFTNGAGLPLSRQVAISGNVTSTIGSLTATPGGSVWFYNAGGILINGGAQINVGSLVLTASDIDTAGGLFDDSGMINFTRAASGTAGVTIAPGARIDVANANPGGAYLAVVAPRIRQGGTVRVDGSAAYVAAEEVGIRINNGLLDINVVVGTDGGQALVHDGSTTGPAHQQDDTDQSRIYMVAIPKNDAVSMLVSGEIGYDDALTAQTDPDGAVILSGGYGIAYGSIGTYPHNDEVAVDISIADAHFLSNTEAHASGTLLAGPAELASPNDGQIVVEGSAAFTGDRSAALNIGAGQGVTVDGGLVLRSTGTGGARVQMDGGLLAVGGDLIVSADAGDGASNNPDGADAQGGTASIRLSGGAITASRIIASAIGRGGEGSIGGDDGPDPIPGGDGGSGRGGTAAITIEGTADVRTASIAAYAIGEGGAGGSFFSGSGISGAPGRGGTGRGGVAGVTVNLAAGGAVTTTDLIVDASGSGGGGGEYYAFSSGPSTGGGIGGRGGDGYGGMATIALAAPILASNQMEAVAQGFGGDGGNHDIGGDGGDASGGTAQAIVTGYDAGYRPVNLHANAQGGDGGMGLDGAGGDGGRAVGGTARVQANGAGGEIAVAASNFRTEGHGGRGGDGGLSPFAVDVAAAPSGGRGGDGIGGTIEVAANDGGTLRLAAENSSPGAFLGSIGYGGGGGAGSPNLSGPGGDGGDNGASGGGTIRLIANGGTIVRSGPLYLRVEGVTTAAGAPGDGPGGNGASGTETIRRGGNVLVEANTGGVVDLGEAEIDARGDTAGRVVLRGGGAIRAASLDIETLGTAAPTNDDVDLAAAGIFLAPTGTGSIRVAGQARLVSDGSIGVHAQGGGTVEAGGPLALTAGDQVDIRHTDRAGTAPTIQSAGDLSIGAGTSIDAAPGSRLAAANIAITAAGAAFIDHADAAGNVTASAAHFRTGLNSIITGGDILITSPGLVDLGNSSAGGLVSVNGLSILFNSIIAGTTVQLAASGPDGIVGGAIDAGGDIVLAASQIALSGPVTGDASLAVYSSGGGAAVDAANVAGSIIVVADGDITGGYIAGGDVTLDSGADITASAAANGGYVDGNGLTANGNLFVQAAGNVTLANAAAARMVGVSAGQAASIAGGSAGEDLLLIGGTTASLSNFTAGDDIRVNAAGDITAQNVATTGAGADSANPQFSPASGFTIVTAAADGADITLTSTGGAIGGANVSAAGDLTGDAAANIAGGAFAAVGDLALAAGNAIGVASAAGGTVTLSGVTGVTAGSVASLGATTLLSGGGAVTIDNLSSVGSVAAIADSILIRDGGDLNFATLVAETGDATVHSSGDLTVAYGQVAGTADLGSDGGAMTVTSLTAADAALAAANGAMTLGDVAATNDLAAIARTGLSIAGGVTGRTVALTSGDIAIQSGGSVGSLGATQLLSIANGNGAGPTFVGGTGSRAGYHIDADELARLHGADIRIAGPGSGAAIGSAVAPDLIVEDFVMTAANLDTGGSLSIETPGKMRVTGLVAIADMTDASLLNLRAGGAIEVILGQGAIRLANGVAPAGRLNLTSGDVIVATPAAIDAVAAATATRAIETRLAENDGVTSDAGALFAGGINAAVSRGFYVQNSGTGTAFAERRGLSFGASGLNVDAANPAVRIVVNGVQISGAGLVTGRDTLALLTVNGAVPASGLFDRGSTLNGCLIINPAACGETATDFPIQNIIEEKDGIEGGQGDEGDGNTLPTALITLRDLDPLTGEPLVDDPVTGAGNDDLWAPPGE